MDTIKRTIVYDTVRITCWRYDPELERIVASYETLDTKGAVIERGEAVFWATMPEPTLAEDGMTLVRPAHWHQLDAKYVQSLMDCTTYMRNMLTPKLTEKKVGPVKD